VIVLAWQIPGNSCGKACFTCQHLQSGLITRQSGKKHVQETIDMIKTLISNFSIYFDKFGWIIPGCSGSSLSQAHSLNNQNNFLASACK
jgi:hypothetical protein